MYQEEQKPVLAENKSSTELLKELFNTFDVEAPLIIKKEKDRSPKKPKKSKKKHKEKKHKKKEKKQKYLSNYTELDKVKKEKTEPSSNIKTEDSYSEDDLTPKIKSEKLSSDNEFETNVAKIKSENEVGSERNLAYKTLKIKNLEFSSIFEATIREIQEKQQLDNFEEGEIQSSDEIISEDKSKLKRKHKHSNEKRKKKRRTCSKDRSRSRSKKDDKEKSPSVLLKNEDRSDTDSKHNKYKNDFYKVDHKYKDGYKSDDYHKDKDYYKSSQKDSSYYKENYRCRSQDRDEHRHQKRSENPFYKESKQYKTKERLSGERDNQWFTRERHRRNNSRDHNYDRRNRDNSSDRDYIDKQKLLEIARKNAMQMMKSGNLPSTLTLGRHAQEKVLAAIRAGGKTVKELTEFCKALSQKEETDELLGGSGNEDRESDNEHVVFHHPFKIKDKPSSIIMNIKNSVPLPTKTSQERNTELRLQFPVSSGTQHRKTENVWVPVSPKKTETQPAINKTDSSTLLAIEAPPESEQLAPAPEKESEPEVFPSACDPNIDLSQIVSQRLLAMRKLQENPYDVEALTTMHKSQKEMQTWVESKQVPGQFTGSTGANILSQAELAAGHQAWAKKDQLQKAAPVSGGMGMHLLKKMGWNPGEGLGKDKTGALQPLLLEVKLDKKGLVANEEHKRKQNQSRIQAVAAKSLEGKHPVSLLGEFTAKRKLGAPEYTLCMESGPDHKKMFLFEVNVNGLVCKPEVAGPNKKQAKADAAKLCLQKLGLLSTLPS